MIDVLKKSWSGSIDRNRSRAWTSGFPDEDYTAKGAKIAPSAAAVADAALILLTCAFLEPAGLVKKGQIIIGFADPLSESRIWPRSSPHAGATLFSMELIPRITRAQSMDVLSSMASIAGYKAVLLAANALPRLFPMMTTAAGTIPPARVLVIGAGVAGLQAIATARRLGAVVSGYDVRAAVKEQIESLGAKFVTIDIGGARPRAKAATRAPSTKRRSGDSASRWPR